MKKTRNAGLIKRLAVFILMLTLLVSLPTLQVSAESMGMMTENIPDTDIKGATGGGGEIISEFASDIMPNPSSDIIPENSTPIVPRNDQAADDANMGNDRSGSVFGVIIAIAVAVSLIMLILAFIPKNKDRGESSDKSDRM